MKISRTGVARRRAAPNQECSVELPDALQFMRLMWALTHALQTASKRMYTKLGVTGPQRLAIRVVGLAPGVSAGELASVLHLHPSTLTGVLARLDAQGLLTRELHPDDRRRITLRLTAKGERVNRAQSGTIESIVRTVLEQVSAQDRRAAAQVFEALGAGLDQQTKPRRNGAARSGR